jgi:hypothetical protein
MVQNRQSMRDLGPMSPSPVNLSPGLPETVLPPAPPEAASALADASAAGGGAAVAAVAAVAARYPRFLAAWAMLGELAAAAGDPAADVEAYAYFRVGYHRGLDALRAAGWRGSGYVRWRHESNRGFLESLDGLRSMAARFGETDEEQRCADFLQQLDPGGRP